MIEIVAADKKWGIGVKGDLLTPLPEDMKFFRETTKNSVVIYGRKTLESFPASQPLKNRINIIITRNADFKCEGAFVVHSVEEAVEDPSTAAQYAVDYGIMDNAAIAEKAIPNCNLCFIDGRKIMRLMKNFIEIMNEANPKSIGGNIPDDNFYYIR